MGANRTSATIKNLHPYQGYEFQVRIRSPLNVDTNNDFWWSEPSNRTTVKMAAAPPDVPPAVNTGTFLQTEDSLIIMWRRLDHVLENGPNFKYSLKLNNG